MTERAFCERAMACERRLYRISYTILHRDADCADAVQEALFRAWCARGTLREEAYFETWLTRILINVCRQDLRRARPIVPLDERMPAPAPEDRELHDALLALPEKYRIPVVLQYMEGYGLREIAGILRLHQGTVSWRISRAKKLLKRALEEEGRTDAETEVR